MKLTNKVVLLLVSFLLLNVLMLSFASRPKSGTQNIKQNNKIYTYKPPNKGGNNTLNPLPPPQPLVKQVENNNEIPDQVKNGNDDDVDDNDDENMKQDGEKEKGTLLPTTNGKNDATENQENNNPQNEFYKQENNENRNEVVKEQNNQQNEQNNVIKNENDNDNQKHGTTNNNEKENEVFQEKINNQNTEIINNNENNIQDGKNNENENNIQTVNDDNKNIIQTTNDINIENTDKNVNINIPNNTKRKIRLKVYSMVIPDPTNEKPYWHFYDLLKDKYDVDYTGEPDFVFYSANPPIADTHKNSIKIYFCGENAVPNFNKCDYAISLNPIEFGDRHFRYTEYMYTEMLFGPWDLHPKLDRNLTKRRFCSFIYRDHNQNLEGVVKREAFFKLLDEYKQIDSPGQIFHNMEMPKAPRTEKTKDVEQWRIDKLAFIKDRKFSIAFENTVTDGYTTEKLPDALRSHTIPIYFGNPNVAKDYNKKAFIDVNDYNSLEDVVKKVIELDNDDDAYMAMLNEPPFPEGSYRPYTELQNFLFNVIDNGKEYLKDPKKIGQ